MSWLIQLRLPRKYQHKLRSRILFVGLVDPATPHLVYHSGGPVLGRIGTGPLRGLRELAYPRCWNEPNAGHQRAHRRRVVARTEIGRRPASGDQGGASEYQVIGRLPTFARWPHREVVWATDVGRKRSQGAPEHDDARRDFPDS